MHPYHLFLTATIALTLGIIGHSNLYAQNSSATFEQLNSYQTIIVTASEYAVFLNEMAKTDLDNLYEPAMGTDSATAAIIRFGTPGNYSYSVLSGREESPISYVDFHSAMRFCDWMKNSSQPRDEIDIRSSTSQFRVIDNSNTSSLSLIAKDSSSKIDNTDSSWKKIASIVALVATASMMAGEDEVVAEDSTTRSRVAPENQRALTLQDFRGATEAYPRAERLVIHEDGTIQPREANPNNAGRNRSENMIITQALRAAIEQEDPIRASLLLPLNSGIIQNPPHISSNSLNNLLHKISPQEESSDEEGKTSQESISNRSSESSEDKQTEEALANTPLENALTSLQEREKEWNRAHPDRTIKTPDEVKYSLSKAATVFQDSKYHSFLEQIINKIKFAANQYLEAEKAYSQGEHSKLEHYLRSLDSAQYSASQYIIAAECLLKAEELDAHTPLAARAWRDAVEARETAGRYYWQEAEASVSLNGAEWNRWRRFAWTTERCAKTSEKIAIFLEKESKASLLGHDSTTIDFWKKGIEREKAAENYYREAFEAHADRNDSAWLRHTRAAEAAQKSAQQFENLATYSQEVIEADALTQGSPIAIVLRKALRKATSAAELYFKTEKAYVEYNQEAENYLKSAHKKANEADKYLSQAGEIRKVSEPISATTTLQTRPEQSPSTVTFGESSTDIDNLEITGADSQDSSQEQKIDPLTDLGRVLKDTETRATLSKDKTERQKRFYLAAKQYQLAIDDLAEKEKYQAAGNIKPAELSTFASEQSQKAGDYLSSSAKKLEENLEQPEVGQASETTFYQAAEYAIKSAASFRDGVRHWTDIKNASEEGDHRKTQLSEQLLENSETVADLYARAADHRKDKNLKTATTLKQAAEAYQKKTTYYQDYYEAVRNSEKTSSNQETVHLWGEIAKKYQLVIRHYDSFLKTCESEGEEAQAKKSKHAVSVIEGRIQELKDYLASLSVPQARPKVIYSTERERSQQGNRRRITIIKREAINPYVRHEEEFDETGKKVGEAEMIADQLLVRLKDDLPKTQEKFLQDLNHPGAWLKEVLSSEPLFVLHFLPEGSSITARTAEEVLNMMIPLLEQIKHNESAVHSEPNFLFNPLSEPEDPFYQQQWNLRDFFGITPPSHLFKKENIATLTLKNPVIVAVIDSGTKYDHEDLKDNMWNKEDEYGDTINGYNALVPKGSALAYNPMDDKSHGTVVSGIIGAVCNNNKGIAGIAGMPDIVKLMPCKFFSKNVIGDTASIIECIKFAREKGAKILNCSFGKQQHNSLEFPQGFIPESIQFLKDALSNEGKDKHVIVVCSAGNSAQDNDDLAKSVYPASYSLPNLIAVAATSQKGTLAKKFSNYGKKSVHIAAPGVLITSTTIPPADPLYTCVDHGTSFAAPHATAALALLIAERPCHQDDIPALINRLLTTTDPLVKLVKFGNHHDIMIDNESIATGRLNLSNSLKSDLLGKFGYIDDLVPLFSEKHDFYEEESLKAMAAIEIRREAEKASIITEFAKDHMLSDATPKKLTWDQVIDKASQAEEAWRNIVENHKMNLGEPQEKVSRWWQEELRNAQFAYQRQVNLKFLCTSYKNFIEAKNVAISAEREAFKSTATKKKAAYDKAIAEWKKLGKIMPSIITDLNERLTAIPPINHLDQVWLQSELQKVEKFDEDTKKEQDTKVADLSKKLLRLKK